MVFGAIKKGVQRIKEALGALMGDKRLPKSVRNVLEKDGDKKIRSITIFRNPIEKAGSMLMNFITLGKYEELKKKYAPDDIFHLGMIITLENGKEYVLEKNEVIALYSGRPSVIKSSVDVPINQDITLFELLDRAEIKGGDKFFSYNAFENNCADFMIMVLNASGLLTAESRKFIKQDLDKLIEELPSVSKAIAKGITDVAGKANQAYQELAKKAGGIIRSRRNKKFIK